MKEFNQDLEMELEERAEFLAQEEISEDDLRDMFKQFLDDHEDKEDESDDDLQYLQESENSEFFIDEEDL